jgi:OOP family OmpA-OmpF porin
MLRTMSVVLVGLFFAVVTAFAQPDLRVQLFADAEKALSLAREKQAEIYAPKNFSKGMEAYNDADDYFKRGKPLDKIKESLREATAAFRRSIEAANLGEKTFPTTMNARTDAKKADASTLYSELWTKAESGFRDAARDLEDGNLSDARKEAAAAEALYRKAELESIKAKYLNPARALLKQADANDTKDDAPKTLAKALKLAADAESRFAQNRYDNLEAQRVAMDARYEASHALYLQRTILQSKRENRTQEDILLASEEPLRQIAAALTLTVPFDSGYGPATQRILAAFSGPDNDKTRVARTLQSQDSAIAALNARLSLVDNKSASSGDQKSDGRAKLEEILGQVQPMFIPDEAVVQIDGNNLLVRLYGLAFTPGKNTLDITAKSLLSRVAASIRKFSKCQVTIEGHTEPIGSELANQRNSEERAESLAASLRAALPHTIAVTSAGYGGSRPIGANGKNKRIDVVIVPEWAIVGK